MTSNDAKNEQIRSQWVQTGGRAIIMYIIIFYIYISLYASFTLPFCQQTNLFIK